MAAGKNAVGMCQRSGEKLPYRRLVRDGENPGLWVSPAWRDIRHEARTPPRVTERTALQHPSSDTDNTSATPVSGSLVANLFPGERYFGGGT